MRERYPRIFSRVYLSGFDPAKLRSKTISIFGVGGIGTLLAEIFVRIGVGRIIIVDKDVVEEENLNRLGFYVDDLGKPKVNVLGSRMRKFSKVRGDEYKIDIEEYYVNIFDFPEIEDVVVRSDCILSAVDNVDARLEMNRLALKYRKVLIDAGTSTNGLRGRVTVVKPYETPCLGCYFSSDTLTSQGVFNDITCNVSLPTTMCIIASIQADQCLRYLLGMEGVAPLILVNLEGYPEITIIKHISRRKDCPYCSK